MSRQFYAPEKKTYVHSELFNAEAISGIRSKGQHQIYQTKQFPQVRKILMPLISSLASSCSLLLSRFLEVVFTTIASKTTIHSYVAFSYEKTKQRKTGIVFHCQSG